LTRLLSKVVGALVAAGCTACYDPVHLDAVADLGPETPGVPVGPNHRIGQPCTTCHGGAGPAKLELSVGGTLFTVRGGAQPLAGGVVTVTDPLGDSRTLTSNPSGNFYVAKGDWDPAFPLSIVLEAEGVRKTMLTNIGRDGSCANCHRGAGDGTYMPGVFLRDK
jgi:hypothetical protein